MKTTQKKEKNIPNKDDFASFLAKEIFKEPVCSIYQFKRGASSFNYLVELQNQKVLVKLAWKYEKKGVCRLMKIIDLVSSQTKMPIANILTFHNKKLFKYRGSFGFVLEYIEGESLPATKINQKHIEQITSAYKMLDDLDIKDEKLLMPAYDFKKIQQLYLSNCEKMIEKFYKKKIFLFFLKKCRVWLLKMGLSSLQILNDKKDFIHGDFHHNNLLFKDDKLIAVLDLEDLGYGYKTEDLLRFVLCMIARQPVFYPKKKILFRYLDYVTEAFPYSIDEWIVGLNSFTLQKYKKMFGHEQKPDLKNIKKMIQILNFMRVYTQVESYLKKKCKN